MSLEPRDAPEPSAAVRTPGAKTTPPHLQQQDTIKESNIVGFPDGKPTTATAHPSPRIAPPAPAPRPPAATEKQGERYYNPRRFPRRPLILAALWILLPVGLWIAALTSLQRTNEPLAPWMSAVQNTNANAVILRPATATVGGPALAVSRVTGYLAAFNPATPETILWKFPTEPRAQLIGNSLGDTLLWLPQQGPFALDSARRPALIVFWRASSPKVHVTALTRDGKELWTQPLEPDADPERAFLRSTPDGPCLAYIATSGPPILLSLDTGLPFVEKPSQP